jgi:hypothetical protein
MAMRERSAKRKSHYFTAAVCTLNARSSAHDKSLRGSIAKNVGDKKTSARQKEAKKRENGKSSKRLHTNRIGDETIQHRTNGTTRLTSHRNQSPQVEMCSSRTTGSV